MSHSSRSFLVHTAGSHVLAGQGIKARVRGFTLIEVLLAIALLSIIMAMAYGGFRASVRATNSGEYIIEQNNRVRVVQQFARRQLMQARSLIIEEADDGEQQRFQGEPHFVRFVSPMPGYLSYGGPYVQELVLERGNSGLELVYYYAMLNGYEPGDLRLMSDGHVLMEDVRSGEFIFLDVDPDSSEPFWTDLWEEPERLPLAVGLTMELNSDIDLIWPDLIVPIMVDSTELQNRNIRRGQEVLRPSQRGAGRRGQRR